MDTSSSPRSPKFAIGSKVLYKSKDPEFHATQYVGQRAVVIRHPLPDVEGYYIEFASGITLIVAESDLEPVK